MGIARSDVHPRDLKAYRPGSQHSEEAPAIGGERAQVPKTGQLKQARSLRREAGHLVGNRGNKIAETAAHFEADPHTLESGPVYLVMQK